MTTADREVTLEEALLLLNEHRGAHVLVRLTQATRGSEMPILESRGELQHPGALFGGAFGHSADEDTRDFFSTHYWIGGNRHTLDLAQLRGAAHRVTVSADADRFVIWLSGDFVLQIWCEELEEESD